jgi:hypothetical protein
MLVLSSSRIDLSLRRLATSIGRMHSDDYAMCGVARGVFSYVDVLVHESTECVPVPCKHLYCLPLGCDP